jgi:hypothetical protein
MTKGESYIKVPSSLVEEIVDRIDKTYDLSRTAKSRWHHSQILKLRLKEMKRLFLMKNEKHQIGRMVMHRHHGIVRLGVIQETKKDSQGWVNYYIRFFEDQRYLASQEHRSSLLDKEYHKETYRSDEVMFIDPEWLNDVLESYGEYHNER